MNALATPTTTGVAPAEGRRGRTGEQVELARYTLPSGERRLLGQRVNGTVIVLDAPADEEHGRVHLVERGLEQDGHAALLAMLDDYLDQAVRMREIPARRSITRLLDDPEPTA